MKAIWIVVADAGRARVFSKVIRAGVPRLLRELDNPAGRLHTSDIVSDQPGRVEKRGGYVQSAMDPPTDPHEQQAMNFARRICALIDTAADRHAFSHLILVAPGHFLGLLISQLGCIAKKRLTTTETKDLTNISIADLERYVTELVRLPGLAAIL